MDKYEFDERAGIYEYEGGLTKTEAEKRAQKEIDERLQNEYFFKLMEIAKYIFEGYDLNINEAISKVSRELYMGVNTSEKFIKRLEDKGMIEIVNNRWRIKK